MDIGYMGEVQNFVVLSTPMKCLCTSVILSALTIRIILNLKGFVFFIHYVLRMKDTK